MVLTKRWLLADIRETGEWYETDQSAQAAAISDKPRCAIRRVWRGVIEHIDHRAERRTVAVMAMLGECDDVVFRLATEAGPHVAAQIRRVPGVELHSGEIIRAAVIERLFLPADTARRVAGTAMALHQICAAIPGGVVAGLVDIAAVRREKEIPDRERPAEAEHRRNLALQIPLTNRRHLLYVEVTGRHHIRVGELGIRRIMHRGIKAMAVLGDALPHGASEIRKAVVPDAGLRVRRDVGRVNIAEWRTHIEPASEGLTASDRMAGNAVAGARQIFAAARGEA